MGLIGSVLRSLKRGPSARRRWAPAGVRELIARGQIAAAAAAVDTLLETTPQRELIALCLKGEVAFHERRDAEAEALFREVLAQAPGLPDAHYGLSLVMAEQGKDDLAVRHAQFAANNGTEACFSAQLGLCHVRRGSHVLATAELERATRLDPHDKASWNNLGIASRARRDVIGARAAFRRALELDPNFMSARSNLELLEEDAAEHAASGTNQPGDEVEAADALDERLTGVRALREQGELLKAADALERISLEHPDDGSLAIELFRLYRDQGDAQSGIDALRAFTAHHPEDWNVVSALGQALVKEREFKQAKPLVEAALERFPDDVAVLLAMADIREEQDRYIDAGALVDRVYELDPSLNNKGRLIASLTARCKYERALELMNEMLQEQPGTEEELLSLRVYALTQTGRHDEALPILDRAITEQPQEPLRRWPRATIHLLHERYAEGWDDYAFRTLSSSKHLRMLPFPLWQGESLEGKTILLMAEQGLGDQVMFASCLPDLLALKPKRVIVEVIDRVAPTVVRSFPQCEIVSTGQDAGFDWVTGLGVVDCFLPMGDLPRRFRRSHADFPAHSGYLRADPERVAYWRGKLAELGPGPHIGLSWRGGSEATRRVVRTMDIGQLAPLTRARAANWVCLQYGDVSADLAKARAAGITLHYWPESIKVLDDFAALITALDLVITVCNTTVHYAGALARPVWIMAPKIPEWRYGMHSKILPWYPSSRIYRQPEAENWQGVLDTLQRRLVDWQPQA
ncbi:tetratricopeptide repeat protein [Methylibium sp.]|uniref:tetratricopeptide repeat protein n=1 Tax=Methylibium sp. TaxID=2067992 RepID=UPI003D0E6983